MARHTILDEDGNPTDRFWSDTDGDPNPDTDQTVYEKAHDPIGSLLGDNTKVDDRFDPSTGEYQK